MTIICLTRSCENVSSTLDHKSRLRRLDKVPDGVDSVDIFFLVPVPVPDMVPVPAMAPGTGPATCPDAVGVPVPVTLTVSGGGVQFVV